MNEKKIITVHLQENKKGILDVGYDWEGVCHDMRLKYFISMLTMVCDRTREFIPAKNVSKLC